MTEKVVITVNEGKIRGVKQISNHSKTPYYAFYGIPYAEQPVHNLRFKDPIKSKKWANIYDGTKEKLGCSQITVVSATECFFWGVEDCLFNNIFTPKLPSEGEPLRPVIITIHGGSFFTGSPHSKHYGSPNFIMQHDVVYVCISYRLHILGFLNLELKECSGNQAFKDVIMSLHWIKENVASFGGDPENITLLGCSSGAATVHALMLSPALDRNLFHKAVLMGGYVMNPIAPHSEANKHHGAEIAKLLGYSGNLDDYSRILKFLQRKSPEELLLCLIRYQNSLPKTHAPITGIGVFSPSIDPHVFPCSPMELIPSMMRIPILVGYCEREAMLGFTRGEMRKQTEDNFYTSFCQNCWGWGHDMKTNEINLIKEQIESFYAEGNPIAKASLSTKVEIQSDISMSDIYDTLIDVIAADLPSSVFVFKFEFEGKLITLKDAGNFEERISGTYHGSEYIYWNCFVDSPDDKQTRDMINSFTKLVTTFAKTGDPNNSELEVRWKPSTLENPCYLSVNNPMQIVEGKVNGERLKFWDNIKKQFSRH
ncbi:esterase FE4-like [Planococcus citri]|uniref:esterase FE4-like n=1 Tax=Planococcus citri TaxID=170843 RepID=UPI0031F8E962